MTAWLATFGLGAGYFISAVPAGVALGLTPWSAAWAAVTGYAAITLAVVLAGSRVRHWLWQRFHLSAQPDPRKWFWRVWQRAGLPGLGLIAPVTCGPWIAALLALSLRESSLRVMAWIILGSLPYAAGFAVAASWATGR